MTEEPAAPVPSPKEVSGVIAFNPGIGDAYFDYDSAALGPDAQRALAHDSAFLKNHPTVKFGIEGHCDERGSEEYNLGLGDRRATVSRSFLVNLGVAPDRIWTISYGKNRPVCTDHVEQCWQRNRWAHIVFGVKH